MSLSEVIKTALDQIQFIARTETVVGEPIIAGSVTLIPVSKISVGFAAGGAEDDKKGGGGAGTGGGVSITPVAFIAIVDGKVQVHSVNKSDLGLGKILAMAPELIQKVGKFMGKGNEKSNTEKKD